MDIRTVLINQDGYTFDEGVAILRACSVAPGVIQFIQRTHNRHHLDAEIAKLKRMPGVRFKMPVPETVVEKVKEPLVTINPTEVHKKKKTEADGTVHKPKQYHEKTRYHDMPNDICRDLYMQKQDAHKLLQQKHLQLRNAPEGEEYNEKRAQLRAEVIQLDEEVKKLWSLIDREIERFEKEEKEVKTAKQADFNISTYRAYISKQLAKKDLKPDQKVELQHRVTAMLDCGLVIAPEQLEKLKAIGIRVE